ncbi:MAG: formate dehydrogenase accessory sulfurtransferase FdhD [Deltaproteobacteria bacterium]|nr:formate dehydrogenase accessory sulfurtransferase FdhD [Deltaproteobacteria bacterium]
MSNHTVSRKVRALTFKEGSFTASRTQVVRETPVTIVLNGEEIVTLLCIDDAPDYLAVGFCLSEGLIRDAGRIESVDVDGKAGTVRVRTSEDRTSDRIAAREKPVITTGCGRGTTFHFSVEGDIKEASDDLRIGPDDIFHLMHELTASSSLYKETRGTHNCALAEGRELLVFRADVGRHNAVDKIYGQCAMEGIPMDNKILITTGRITSEIVLKIGRMGLPVLISRHAATDLAVQLGVKYKRTLIGLVRGGKFTAYSGFRRIIGHSESGA